MGEIVKPTHDFAVCGPSKWVSRYKLQTNKAERGKKSQTWDKVEHPKK